METGSCYDYWRSVIVDLFQSINSKVSTIYFGTNLICYLFGITCKGNISLDLLKEVLDHLAAHGRKVFNRFNALGQLYVINLL